MKSGKPAVTAATMNQMRPNTLMESLDIVFLEPEDGYLRASMPVDQRTQQPLGLLHGGASAALAETLGSTASYFLIDREKQFCSGLEINANHLRPAKKGRVIGTCRPLHLGATTHVWDIRITDEDDRLVCISRLTVAIRNHR